MDTLFREDYARGTYVIKRRRGTEMFVGFLKARALCPDGVLRVVELNSCADDPWTVKARLRYRRRTVTGVVEFRDAQGMTLDSKTTAVLFKPAGKHAGAFSEPPPPGGTNG